MRWASEHGLEGHQAGECDDGESEDGKRRSNRLNLHSVASGPRSVAHDVGPSTPVRSFKRLLCLFAQVTQAHTATSLPLSLAVKHKKVLRLVRFRLPS